MSNIKVAVRVRPLNKKEAKKKGRSIIQVRGKVVSIENPKKYIANLHDGFEAHKEFLKHFIFDFAFSPSPHRRLSTLLPSIEPLDETFHNISEEDLLKETFRRGIIVDANAEQDEIYQQIGVAAEISVVKGYNACILAYGQSGSGKTYTVLGCKDSPGLSPRICKGLLERLEQKWPPGNDVSSRDFSLSLSLIEIYKERVRDLLSEVKNARVLRVREHPTTGPYVDGVTWHSIGNVEIAWNLLERGRAARSVGPTSIHSHSSRSHALMTLKVGQPAIHTRSSLTLVDLAGSERANEASDKNRLKEGASINRSLVTLGNVISALAERGLGISATKVRSISCPQVIQRTPMEEGGSWGCPGPPHSHQGQKAKFSQGHGPRLPFIPYRDSVLTWLLKDTLGGNSNTFMIATLSPSGTCYKESLSTMRYATRARRIVNRPVVNVDPTTTTISSLKQEIALLRQLLYYRYKDSFDRLSFGGKFSLQDSSSKITSQKSDKQNQNKNNANSPKRKNATAIPPDGASGNGTRDVEVECGMPYFINTLNDELADRIVIYHLKKGTSILGTGQNCDLRVPGNGVNSFHCSLTHGYGHSGVTLRVLCGSLQVENTRIVKGEVVRLRDGNIIRIGSREFTFRLATRKETKKKRPKARHTLLSRARILSCLAKPIPQCHRKSKSASLPLSYIRSPRWTRSLSFQKSISKSPRSQCKYFEKHFKKESFQSTNSNLGKLFPMKRRDTQTNKCKIKEKSMRKEKERFISYITGRRSLPVKSKSKSASFDAAKSKTKTSQLPSKKNLPSLIKTKLSTEESLLSDSSGSRIEQRVRKEPQGCCSSTVFSEKAKKNRRWRTDRCFHDLTDSDTNSNQITDEVLKEKEVEKKALMKRRAFSKGRNSDKRPNSLSLQANTWSGSESGQRKPKRSVSDNKKVMNEKFSKFSSSEKGSLSLEKISSKSDLESSDINDDDTRGESFPYGERISPIGASHSEGNASFTKSSLFHRDHDVFASDMVYSPQSTFAEFPSDNSLDSSSVFDTRKAHFFTSETFSLLPIVDRRKYINSKAKEKGWFSESTTPINSPVSPTSETRRRWDKSIWPEVEKDLKRNYSVPNLVIQEDCSEDFFFYCNPLETHDFQEKENQLEDLALSDNLFYHPETCFQVHENRPTDSSLLPNWKLTYDTSFQTTDDSSFQTSLPLSSSYEDDHVKMKKLSLNTHDESGFEDEISKNIEKESISGSNELAIRNACINFKNTDINLESFSFHTSLESKVETLPDKTEIFVSSTCLSTSTNDDESYEHQASIVDYSELEFSSYLKESAIDSSNKLHIPYLGHEEHKSFSEDADYSDDSLESPEITSARDNTLEKVSLFKSFEHSIPSDSAMTMSKDSLEDDEVKLDSSVVLETSSERLSIFSEPINISSCQSVFDSTFSLERELSAYSSDSISSDSSQVFFRVNEENKSLKTKSSQETFSLSEIDLTSPKTSRKLLRKEVEKRIPCSSSSDESDVEQSKFFTRKKRRSKSSSYLFSSPRVSDDDEYNYHLSDSSEYHPKKVNSRELERGINANVNPAKVKMELYKSSDSNCKNVIADEYEEEKSTTSVPKLHSTENLFETASTDQLLEESSKKLLSNLGVDPESPEAFSLFGDVKNFLEESSKKLTEFSLLKKTNSKTALSQVMHSPKKDKKTLDFASSLDSQVNNISHYLEFSEKNISSFETFNIASTVGKTPSIQSISDKTYQESSEETSESSGRNSPCSDGSTEVSWEEMTFEDPSPEKSGFYKSFHALSSLAKRHLYTIMECSENSQTEGIASESDVIPSDWRDSCSEADHPINISKLPQSFNNRSVVVDDQLVCGNAEFEICSKIESTSIGDDSEESLFEQYDEDEILCSKFASLQLKPKSDENETVEFFNGQKDIQNMEDSCISDNFSVVKEFSKHIIMMAKQRLGLISDNEKFKETKKEPKVEKELKTLKVENKNIVEKFKPSSAIDTLNYIDNFNLDHESNKLQNNRPVREMKNINVKPLKDNRTNETTEIISETCSLKKAKNVVKVNYENDKTPTKKVLRETGSNENVKSEFKQFPTDDNQDDQYTILYTDDPPSNFTPVIIGKDGVIGSEKSQDNKASKEKTLIQLLSSDANNSVVNEINDLKFEELDEIRFHMNAAYEMNIIGPENFYQHVQELCLNEKNIEEVSKGMCSPPQTGSENLLESEDTNWSTPCHQFVAQSQSFCSNSGYLTYPLNEPIKKSSNKIEINPSYVTKETINPFAESEEREKHIKPKFSEGNDFTESNKQSLGNKIIVKENSVKTKFYEEKDVNEFNKESVENKTLELSKLSQGKLNFNEKNDLKIALNFGSINEEYSNISEKILLDSSVHDSNNPIKKINLKCKLEGNGKVESFCDDKNEVKKDVHFSQTIENIITSKYLMPENIKQINDDDEYANDVENLPDTHNLLSISKISLPSSESECDLESSASSVPEYTTTVMISENTTESESSLTDNSVIENVYIEQRPIGSGVKRKPLDHENMKEIQSPKKIQKTTSGSEKQNLSESTVFSEIMFSDFNQHLYQEVKSEESEATSLENLSQLNNEKRHFLDHRDLFRDSIKKEDLNENTHRDNRFLKDNDGQFFRKAQEDLKSKSSKSQNLEEKILPSQNLPKDTSLCRKKDTTSASTSDGDFILQSSVKSIKTSIENEEANKVEISKSLPNQYKGKASMLKERIKKFESHSSDQNKFKRQSKKKLPMKSHINVKQRIRELDVKFHSTSEFIQPREENLTTHSSHKSPTIKIVQLEKSVEQFEKDPAKINLNSHDFHNSENFSNYPADISSDTHSSHPCNIQGSSRIHDNSVVCGMNYSESSKSLELSKLTGTWVPEQYTSVTSDISQEKLDIETVSVLSSVPLYLVSDTSFIMPKEAITSSVKFSNGFAVIPNSEELRTLLEESSIAGVLSQGEIKKKVEFPSILGLTSQSLPRNSLATITQPKLEDELHFLENLNFSICSLESRISKTMNTSFSENFEFPLCYSPYSTVTSENPLSICTSLTSLPPCSLSFFQSSLSSKVSQSSPSLLSQQKSHSTFLRVSPEESFTFSTCTLSPSIQYVTSVTIYVAKSSTEITSKTVRTTSILTSVLSTPIMSAKVNANCKEFDVLVSSSSGLKFIDHQYSDGVPLDSSSKVSQQLLSPFLDPHFQHSSTTFSKEKLSVSSLSPSSFKIRTYMPSLQELLLNSSFNATHSPSLLRARSQPEFLQLNEEVHMQTDFNLALEKNEAKSELRTISQNSKTSSVVNSISMPNLYIPQRFQRESLDDNYKLTPKSYFDVKTSPCTSNYFQESVESNARQTQIFDQSIQPLKLDFQPFTTFVYDGQTKEEKERNTIYEETPFAYDITLKRNLKRSLSLSSMCAPSSIENVVIKKSFSQSNIMNYGNNINTKSTQKLETFGNTISSITERLHHTACFENNIDKRTPIHSENLFRDSRNECLRESICVDSEEKTEDLNSQFMIFDKNIKEPGTLELKNQYHPYEGNVCNEIFESSGETLIDKKPIVTSDVIHLALETLSDFEISNMQHKELEKQVVQRTEISDSCLKIEPLSVIKKELSNQISPQFLESINLESRKIKHSALDETDFEFHKFNWDRELPVYLPQETIMKDESLYLIAYTDQHQRVFQKTYSNGSTQYLKDMQDKKLNGLEVAHEAEISDSFLNSESLSVIKMELDNEISAPFQEILSENINLEKREIKYDSLEEAEIELGKCKWDKKLCTYFPQQTNVEDESSHLFASENQNQYAFENIYANENDFGFKKIFEAKRFKSINCASEDYIFDPGKLESFSSSNFIRNNSFEALQFTHFQEERLRLLSFPSISHGHQNKLNVTISSLTIPVNDHKHVIQEYTAHEYPDSNYFPLYDSTPAKVDFSILKESKNITSKNRDIGVEKLTYPPQESSNALSQQMNEVVASASNNIINSKDIVYANQHTDLEIKHESPLKSFKVVQETSLEKEKPIIQIANTELQEANEKVKNMNYTKGSRETIKKSFSVPNFKSNDFYVLHQNFQKSSFLKVSKSSFDISFDFVNKYIPSPLHTNERVFKIVEDNLVPFDTADEYKKHGKAVGNKKLKTFLPGINENFKSLSMSNIQEEMHLLDEFGSHLPYNITAGKSVQAFARDFRDVSISTSKEEMSFSTEEPKNIEQNTNNEKYIDKSRHQYLFTSEVDSSILTTNILPHSNISKQNTTDDQTSTLSHNISRVSTDLQYFLDKSILRNIYRSYSAPELRENFIFPHKTISNDNNEISLHNFAFVNEVAEGADPSKFPYMISSDNSISENVYESAPQFQKQNVQRKIKNLLLPCNVDESCNESLKDKVTLSKHSKADNTIPSNYFELNDDHSLATNSNESNSDSKVNFLICSGVLQPTVFQNYNTLNFGTNSALEQFPLEYIEDVIANVNVNSCQAYIYGDLLKYAKNKSMDNNTFKNLEGISSSETFSPHTSISTVKPLSISTYQTENLSELETNSDIEAKHQPFEPSINIYASLNTIEDDYEKELPLNYLHKSLNQSCLHHELPYIDPSAHQGLEENTKPAILNYAEPNIDIVASEFIIEIEEDSTKSSVNKETSFSVSGENKESENAEYFPLHNPIPEPQNSVQRNLKSQNDSSILPNIIVSSSPPYTDAVNCCENREELNLKVTDPEQESIETLNDSYNKLKQMWSDACSGGKLLDSDEAFQEFTTILQRRRLTKKMDMEVFKSIIEKFSSNEEEMKDDTELKPCANIYEESSEISKKNYEDLRHYFNSYVENVIPLEEKVIEFETAFPVQECRMIWEEKAKKENIESRFKGNVMKILNANRFNPVKKNESKAFTSRDKIENYKEPYSLDVNRSFEKFSLNENKYKDFAMIVQDLCFQDENEKYKGSNLTEGDKKFIINKSLKQSGYLDCYDLAGINKSYQSSSQFAHRSTHAGSRLIYSKKNINYRKSNSSPEFSSDFKAFFTSKAEESNLQNDNPYNFHKSLINKELKKINTRFNDLLKGNGQGKLSEKSIKAIRTEYINNKQLGDKKFPSLANCSFYPENQHLESMELLWDEHSGKRVRRLAYADNIQNARNDFLDLNMVYTSKLPVSDVMNVSHFGYRAISTDDERYLNVNEDVFRKEQSLTKLNYEKYEENFIRTLLPVEISEISTQISGIHANDFGKENIQNLKSVSFIESKMFAEAEIPEVSENRSESNRVLNINQKDYENLRTTPLNIKKSLDSENYSKFAPNKNFRVSLRNKCKYFIRKLFPIRAKPGILATDSCESLHSDRYLTHNIDRNISHCSNRYKHGKTQIDSHKHTNVVMPQGLHDSSILKLENFEREPQLGSLFNSKLSSRDPKLSKKYLYEAEELIKDLQYNNNYTTEEIKDHTWPHTRFQNMEKSLYQNVVQESEYSEQNVNSETNKKLKSISKSALKDFNDQCGKEVIETSVFGRSCKLANKHWDKENAQKTGILEKMAHDNVKLTEVEKSKSSNRDNAIDPLHEIVSEAESLLNVISESLNKTQSFECEYNERRETASLPFSFETSLTENFNSTKDSITQNLSSSKTFTSNESKSSFSDSECQKYVRPRKTTTGHKHEDNTFMVQQLNDLRKKREKLKTIFQKYENYSSKVFSSRDLNVLTISDKTYENSDKSDQSTNFSNSNFSAVHSIENRNWDYYLSSPTKKTEDFSFPELKYSSRGLNYTRSPKEKFSNKFSDGFHKYEDKSILENELDTFSATSDTAISKSRYQEEIRPMSLPIYNYNNTCSKNCCVPDEHVAHHAYCSSSLFTPMPKERPTCHSAFCYANTLSSSETNFKKNKRPLHSYQSKSKVIRSKILSSPSELNLCTSYGSPSSY